VPENRWAIGGCGEVGEQTRVTKAHHRVVALDLAAYIYDRISPAVVLPKLTHGVCIADQIGPAALTGWDHRPSRLYQVLAWVGIIAGAMFIVAVIFFSGVFFGRASGGYHGWASRLPRRPDGAGRLDGRLPDDAARRNDGTPLE